MVLGSVPLLCKGWQADTSSSGTLMPVLVSMARMHISTMDSFTMVPSTRLDIGLKRVVLLLVGEDSIRFPFIPRWRASSQFCSTLAQSTQYVPC